MIVKRNPSPSYFAIGICSVFVLTWIANQFGYAQVDGANTIWAVLFVFLFALPILMFSAYSAFTTTPYIELSDREVKFCSVNTPWKTTGIRTDDIIELSTHWIPRTTRCMLSLRLSETAYHATVGDWTWAKRGDGWVHFHMMHSGIDPHSAAKMLSEVTGIPYTIEQDG
jgi:hypothetical protein